MTLHRDGVFPPLIDLLDRVLDKGIVIDASVRVAPAGIDLLTLRTRPVVASIETYVGYGRSLMVDLRFYS